MQIRRFILHLAVLAFLAFTVSIAKARTIASICDAMRGNLVQNCGFEKPANGLDDQSFPDWTTHNFDAYNYIADNPHSGRQSLQIGNYAQDGLAVVSQSFSDIAGDDYTFSFYERDYGPGETLELFTAGVDSRTYLRDDGSTDSGNYTLYSYTLRATGHDTIYFSAYNTYSEFGLDDVFFGDPTVVPTPEPGSIVLLCTGLMTCAGAAFRRFRARQV